jgi:hypothetical protein
LRSFWQAIPLSSPSGRCSIPGRCPPWFFQQEPNRNGSPPVKGLGWLAGLSMTVWKGWTISWIQSRNCLKIGRPPMVCNTPYLGTSFEGRIPKFVDKCPKYVDKPRGLWKSRSIVRNLWPYMWGVFSQLSKMLFPFENGPWPFEKGVWFSYFFPQSAMALKL